MGNRAVIAFGKSSDSVNLKQTFGIYLHWNGGRESVQGFLYATKELMKQAGRGPDGQYGPARLVQIIGNFLGGALSLGLGPLCELDCDNGDNGTFVVDPETMEIVGRLHKCGERGFNKEYCQKVRDQAIENSRNIFCPPSESKAA